jgi:threonine dehydrogenase-like Zn-dependent dehydrogenase
MKAIVFERRPVRYVAAAIAGRLSPGAGARVGPLRLRDVDPPEPPGADWVRVRPRLAGICGSDLATIDGASSRYFEPIVSFPFTPGHEIVGDLDDGARVVVVPTLTCEARGVVPPCDWCARGVTNRCERTAFGHLEPGLQTGYCTDTGGGWSIGLVAHRSQLRPVPDDMSDEEAVLVEPTACAVHAARRIVSGEVVIIGAGTLGLLTLAALRHFGDTAGPVVITAKHPEQRRLARELGADHVVEPRELSRRIRSLTRSLEIGMQLTCGADHVVDCVGTSDSLAQALSVVAPGGEVHLVGMPGPTTLDLTGLWHREVAIRGCYAYTPDDVTLAFDAVRAQRLGRLVSASYPLARYEEAIEHAANAGERGAVKVVFDLRGEKERDR